MSSSSNPIITLLSMLASPLVLCIYIVRRMYWSCQPQRIRTNNTPSYTAEMVCEARCVGDTLGLMKDPFAWEFLQWDARFFAFLAISMHNTFGTSVGRRVCMMVARTLTIDDAILQYAPKQLVILGAGFDARAYRLAISPNTVVWEVDHPSTQRVKKRVVTDVTSRLPKMFTRKLNQVQFVEVDFATESFMDKLIAQGFDVKEPSTMFTLEGVASYLTYEELINTMKNISTQCVPGTKLIMNNRRVGHGWYQYIWHHFFTVIGEPVKFQVQDKDDLNVLFGKSTCGFTVEKVEEFSDMVKKWVPAKYAVTFQGGIMISLRV